jgi:hypothetical protein
MYKAEIIVLNLIWLFVFFSDNYKQWNPRNGKDFHLMNPLEKERKACVGEYPYIKKKNTKGRL